MPFEIVPTRLEGPKLVQPKVFGDARGFFVETYRRSDFVQLGIQEEMVQDNHSRSVRGVVRGIHFSVGRGAGKLVRCARGEIFDVLVDLRRGSPTYGQWEGYVLDEETMRVLYAPAGFGHGFCVTSSVADVIYMQDAYYDPAVEREFRYDDPAVAIDWPIAPEEAQVSDRDINAPLLSDIAADLPFTYTGPATMIGR